MGTSYHETKVSSELLILKEVETVCTDSMNFAEKLAYIVSKGTK